MKVLEFIASELELYEQQMKPVCERYALTSMELAILLFLANNPGLDTATDIVEKRHLTKSHVSMSVRSLVEKGYLKKEHRNSDNRTHHLVLLPASQKIVSVGKERQAEFLSLIMKGFSEEETEQMEKFISRMNDNVLQAQKGSRNAE